VAAYPFDERAGDTTADSSGNSHTGTLFNVVRTKGKFGNALSFNGVDSYVTAPALGLPPSNAEQTIAYWISINAETAMVRPVVSLVNEAQQTSVQPGFKDSKIGVWQSPGSWFVAGNAPSAGKWHHVAYTFDGQTHRFYVDGNEVSSSTIVPSPAAPTSLQIGRMIGDSYYFKGTLDELRIYSRALAQAEIQALMMTATVSQR
jgi:hypothetical protein